MKRYMWRTITTILLVAGTVTLAGVRETKHNFTSATYSPNAYFTGTRQVCVFCHTVHNADQATGALWNHEQNSPLYDTYDQAELSMTITQPHEGSLVCLSCHDGTLAVNSLNNVPGPAGAGNYGDPGGSALDGSGKLTSSSSAFLGTDLTNDHPVGITYDASQAPGMYQPKTGNPANYPDKLLDDGVYVECNSCHNPHDNTYSNFLIESNANSALCMRCHII